MHIKRIFAFLLSVALIIGGLPISAFATEQVEATNADWTGYTAISTKAQLNAVRNKLNGKYYLTNDIVFTAADFAEGGSFYNNGAGWVPIGNKSSWSFPNISDGFTGIFDGNGHTISGLSINISTSKLDYVGLFACNNGTITNLTVQNAEINITSSDHVYAGSIAGLNYDGEISNSRSVDCVVKSKSTGASSTAGGIVGFTRSESLVKQCYSSSNVFGESNAYAYAGGIVGSGGGSVTNCYNTGLVKATYLGSSGYSAPGAGGIVGHVQSTKISNCYNVGYVGANASVGSTDVGGICGSTTSPTISNCYYLGITKYGTGSGDNGTTKCTENALKNTATFAGYDFNSVWDDTGANDYAYPELVGMPHLGNVRSKDIKDWTGYTAISTPAELNAIRDNPSGKYYLATDIVFNESDFAVGGAFYNDGACWLPIGADSSTAFSGILDGNGHKISGLKINHSGETIIYIGLFGYSSGTITDLMLTDCEIVATAETATLDIGGIVGYNNRNGSLRRCSFDGTINTVDYAGGLAGVNWGTVEECYNAGAINSDFYAGGIVGTNYETISNCYNIGAISGDYYSGGIVATNSGTVNLSYNIGSINSGYYKGGISGKNSDIISSCYYLDSTSLGSGYGADTAIKCSIDQMQTEQIFDAFDFDFVWVVNDASHFPLPQLRNWPHRSANSNTTDFAGGTGDVWDPYIITNTTHLNNVRKDLNANYALGADIVFEEADFNAGGDFYNDGKGWEPIGVATAPFAGSFDGRGYSIKGLKISAGIEGDTHIGLFGYVNGSAASTIKNVNAVDFDISILGNSISTSTSYSDVYVGTIVGYGSAKNCSSTGKIDCTYSSSTRKAYLYIGGVIGYGSATNCTNSCAITLNINSGSAHISSFVGGVAGRGYTVSQCVNRGTIDAYSKRTWNSYIEAGGIAGYATTVNQCGNIGSVTAGGYSDVNHIYTGGILGRGTDTSTVLDQCYNTAAIKGERGEYTGGIVGYLGNNSRITNAFNAGAILNGASGGIVGYASSGTSIKNCYNVGYVEQGYDIAYRTYSDAVIENCYCLEGVATNRAGVTVCTDQEMQSAATFSNFDFDTIWQVGNNSKYAWPELKGMPAENDLIHIGDSVVALVPTKVTYHDVQPDFTVKYNGDLLKLNEDYIAFFIVGDDSWRVNTQTRSYIHDVGVGKLLIIGNGDFCFTTTYEFNIEKYDMSKASLWTPWVPDGTGGMTSGRFMLDDFNYDGTAKEQSGFRVTDTYDTIEDGNFEIAYENNVEPGTAKMIITGVGEYYTGQLVKTFTIYPGHARGDFTKDGSIDNKDVEYLLWHTLFADTYPVESNADFNGDGTVDNKDVEYLLWYTLFPESYPL